eukprot:m.29080 g.29080  ORF g.29080 m.29080 type:complete len:981 (+) comp8062_c0_seq1:266-3208(+)
MEGYVSMLLSSPMRTAWRQRYLTLELQGASPYVAFYADEKKKVNRGKVLLRDIAWVSDDSNGRNQGGQQLNAFAFEHNSGKVFRFRCETEQDRRSWVLCLRESLDLVAKKARNKGKNIMRGNVLRMASMVSEMDFDTSSDIDENELPEMTADMVKVYVATLDGCKAAIAAHQDDLEKLKKQEATLQTSLAGATDKAPMLRSALQEQLRSVRNECDKLREKIENGRERLSDIEFEAIRSIKPLLAQTELDYLTEMTKLEVVEPDSIDDVIDEAELTANQGDIEEFDEKQEIGPAKGKFADPDYKWSTMLDATRRNKIKVIVLQKVDKFNKKGSFNLGGAASPVSPHPSKSDPHPDENMYLVQIVEEDNLADSKTYGTNRFQNRYRIAFRHQIHLHFKIFQPLPNVKDENEKRSPRYHALLRRLAEKAKPLLDACATRAAKLSGQSASDAQKPPSVDTCELKELTRSVVKVESKYKGNYSRLVDIARNTIKHHSIKDIANTIKAFRSDDTIKVLEIKERLSDPHDAGYRDVLVKVLIKEVKHVAEIQLTLVPLMEIKSHGGHLAYKITRALRLSEEYLKQYVGLPSAWSTKLISKGAISHLHHIGATFTSNDVNNLRKSLEDPSCRVSILRMTSCEVADEENIVSILTTPVITNLQVMMQLEIYDSGLTGPVPEALKYLSTSIKYIGLSRNKLEGPIPSWIGKYKNLRVLRFFENNMSGPIPDSLWNLYKLEILELEQNEFTGTISPAIGNLKKMKLLYIFKNQFDGKLPEELWSLTSLENLDISDNRFAGQLSENIGQLQNLQVINTTNNNFVGPVPKSIYNLESLEGLYINDNEFTGAIHPNIKQLRNLKFFYTGNNQMSGQIPPELYTLIKLEQLVVFDNRFEGNISPDVVKLKNLKVFSVSGTYMSGVVPQEMYQLEALEQLFLSFTSLEGRIPPKIGSQGCLPNLTIVDVRDTKMIGNLPKKLRYVDGMDIPPPEAS